MKHIKIHSQPTQPSTFAIRTSRCETKNYKRACLFATAFLPTLKTNFFGNSSTSIKRIFDYKKTINWLIMNEHQQLTRYIKHLAESANFRGGTFNKLRNGLIGNRFEMPNVSNTHPLAVRQRNGSREHKKLDKMKQTIKKIIFCALTILVSLQSFAIKPDRVYRFYPEKLCLIYKDIDVTTVDGIKIKTWFFPAQPTPSEKEMSDMLENHREFWQERL